MTEFRIGQRVRVIAGPRAGLDTSIIDGPRQGVFPPGSYWHGRLPDGAIVYAIDAATINGTPGCRAAEPPHHLAPIDDDTDRTVAAEMDSWLDRVVRKGRVGA